MHWPVVTVKERKLHVPFLGGEAYWILNGDDTVDGIKEYNRHIVQFSDDGERFFGAYGPKVVAQLPYVVDKLIEDLFTRQAGLTIWRESPPKTKDVPCTVAMFFSVRNGKLNTHVYMRSSDAWLGLPYDAFNFTMISCQVIKELSRRTNGYIHPQLGMQYITAASSHLYEQHWDEVHKCLDKVPLGWSIPSDFTNQDTDLLTLLDDLRNSKKGDAIRWFEMSSDEDFIYLDNVNDPSES